MLVFVLEIGEVSLGYGCIEFDVWIVLFDWCVGVVGQVGFMIQQGLLGIGVVQMVFVQVGWCEVQIINGVGWLYRCDYVQFGKMCEIIWVYDLGMFIVLVMFWQGVFIGGNLGLGFFDLVQQQVIVMVIDCMDIYLDVIVQCFDENIYCFVWFGDIEIGGFWVIVIG